MRVLALLLAAWFVTGLVLGVIIGRIASLDGIDLEDR